MQFLFSNYEKEVIKERCQNGIRDSLTNGEWVGHCPFGYTQVGIKKDRKYVINEEGKLIRKAFVWKAEGKTSEDILKMLKSRGIKLYSQHLSRIFRNPFYCGLISHSALNGEVYKGNHPALVSQELFLKANKILQGNTQGYKHNQDEEHLSNLPLKNFVKCAKCGVAYTGYLVKKKGLFYYKCNGKGCKCNRNAKVMNNLFEEFLSSYNLNPNLTDPLKFALEYYLDAMSEESEQDTEVLEKQLREVQKKLDTIEERFVLSEITTEMFQKFMPKYRQEKEQILKELGKYENNLSNLQNRVDEIAQSTSNVLKMWRLGSYENKRKLQNLVFPDGIHYDREKDNYRTLRVNSVFGLSRYISENYRDKKTGTKDLIACLSPSVARRGIEPLLPG
ncbi:recombinase family protein [Fulvivirga sp. 29W222]|uniref:Recombinase family protein n=1 Tax=Fulvivirga marina TaxID=2494733 RepID=A0A937KCA1_9BACT|nr:recombinase family protein [Fulvivirga marina]